jgi:serine-type D-Ala-D-Ala carboxypeptidase (penicillin-binding protein 5/6)
VQRRRHSRILTLVLVVAGGAALFAGPAQTVTHPASAPLALSARSAILIDQATGRVLYQSNPDESLVPASLAKLMTLHIVYQKLDEKFISRNDVVALSANAWADNQYPGSTLMHLGPGQIVTVEELMRGVAIASGNDAAVALAEYVAGSATGFVRMMNDEARFMGYRSMHFVDPAGVDPGNRVTARELADFCRRYIDLHPEALEELHSLREFDYPLPQNMPGGRLRRTRTVKQYNGNYLVWDGIGVDGLKTGHLDDENFTAATTARRGDTRLVAVVLGVPGHSLTDGARNRTDDTMALLNYGFRNFTTRSVEPPTVKPVFVWAAAERDLPVTAEGPIRITARQDEQDRLTCTVLVHDPLVAPIARGQKIGDIVYAAGDEEVARVPLLAARDIERAGLLRRTLDGMALGLLSVVSRATDLLQSGAAALHPSTVVSASKLGPGGPGTP